ncbi:glycoside hydrolase family 27 protein [Butyrivibrio fibrisolvens]|uniref:glycoside hydrolase family 27 protein n=1 Tax=Butyrivibrio fibrisolvens TaxID=831 RepID=UPI0003B37AF5|nr:glycoside hydrolase family 27 protein [Butyrivibrio fibrisolvens]
MASDKITRTSREHPQVISSKDYRYDSFNNGKTFEGKKKRLPAMGWNSWNAFGSGNTEALTKAMADRFIELELDKAGYEYLVLDDGCYNSERVDGKLTNEPLKFPSGFKALADYIHAKGLKFGMYNDIGTNLCAGSAVGTCGFEDVDAVSYTDWDIDFLKVDNCYYLWDNATFSNGENARYTYAPRIKAVKLVSRDGSEYTYDAVTDGVITGRHARIEESYVTNIGTFDGTNIGNTPVGDQSSELTFDLKNVTEGSYKLYVTYATGKEAGVGEWLQVAVSDGSMSDFFFDNLVESTQGPEDFKEIYVCDIAVKGGDTVLRLMNHRRQENTLCSYAAMYNSLKEADPNKDILLSICEWGKTMPSDWGYKVGDSWRILNDITFQVGRDGDPGRGYWEADGTCSITSQYDKCVIMDEFASLERGWNDPDMMVIGMGDVDETMAKTHFAMWSMMNSPLMLGMDLRKVEKGDYIWNIITNKDIIALNQDALGVQAKRVWSSLADMDADKIYLMDHNRVDILAKPLAGGDIAVTIINLSGDDNTNKIEISLDNIVSAIEGKMADPESFKGAQSYEIKDLWTGEENSLSGRIVSVDGIKAHDNVTLRVSPIR